MHRHFKRNAYLALYVAVFAISGYSYAIEIELDNSLEIESAIGIQSATGHKLESIFTPEIKAELPDDVELTAIARMRSDAYNHLTPSTHSHAEIRELYITKEIGDAFITLGKQQIVWGKADGIKVLDVVNPQDFREFILDDFEDSRIPLWTANIEIPLGDIDAQFLWIPDQTYHKLPETGAAFALTSPLLLPTVPAGIPVNILPVAKPNRFLADSEAGLRLSTFWKGWDLSLNYLYHYDDTPVFFRRINPNATSITITPKHTRNHLIGATFSTAIGKLTLRGEVGYGIGRTISTNSISDADGVVKTDELSYVLGFDWFGFSDTLISLQLFQTWLPKYRQGVIRERLDTSTSLLVRRNFSNDTVIVETLWIHNANQGDGLIRPKITYALNDHISLWAGADIFYGNQKGLYGQFNKLDRMTSSFEINF